MKVDRKSIVSNICAQIHKNARWEIRRNVHENARKPKLAASGCSKEISAKKKMFHESLPHTFTVGSVSVVSFQPIRSGNDAASEKPNSLLAGFTSSRLLAYQHKF